MKKLLFVSLITAILLTAIVGCSYDITKVNQEVKGGETLPLVPTADLNKMARLVNEFKGFTGDKVTTTDYINAKFQNLKIIDKTAIPEVEVCTIESGTFVLEGNIDKHEYDYSITINFKEIKDTTLTDYIGTNEITSTEDSITIANTAYTSTSDEYTYMAGKIKLPNIEDSTNPGTDILKLNDSDVTTLISYVKKSNDYSGEVKVQKILTTSYTNQYYGEVKEGSTLDWEVSSSCSNSSRPVSDPYNFSGEYYLDNKIKLTANVGGKDVFYDYDSAKETLKVGSESYRCSKDLFWSTLEKTTLDN